MSRGARCKIGRPICIVIQWSGCEMSMRQHVATHVTFSIACIAIVDSPGLQRRRGVCLLLVSGIILAIWRCGHLGSVPATLLPSLLWLYSLMLRCLVLLLHSITWRWSVPLLPLLLMLLLRMLMLMLMLMLKLMLMRMMTNGVAVVGSLVGLVDSTSCLRRRELHGGCEPRRGRLGRAEARRHLPQCWISLLNGIERATILLVVHLSLAC